MDLQLFVHLLILFMMSHPPQMTCHFLLERLLTFALTCSEVLVAQLCPTLLQPHGLWPTRLFCPWDCPGKNGGLGCHFLHLHSLPYLVVVNEDVLRLVPPATPLLSPQNTGLRHTQVSCAAGDISLSKSASGLDPQNLRWRN